MPSIIEEQVIDLEKSVFSLEKENEIHSKIYQKIEESMEKMQDLTEAMHIMITLHDERIKVNAQIVETLKAEMNKDIKELEDHVNKINTELSTKIENTEKKILDKIEAFEKKWTDKNESKKESISNIKQLLEKWKFFILGGAIVLGIVLGKTGLISNIFSMIYYVL